jgi:hypothetical protein
MTIKKGEIYEIRYVSNNFKVKVTDIYDISGTGYIEYEEVSEYKTAKRNDTAEYFKICIMQANAYNQSSHLEEIEI